MLLRLLIVIAAILTAFFIPVFIVNFKDVFLWRHEIKKALKKLHSEKRLFCIQKQRAIGIIDRKTNSLFNVSQINPDILTDIKSYVANIAACFHPEAENPELRASLGHILYCLDKSAVKFDIILSRPGFKKIADVNLKTIHNLHLMKKNHTSRRNAKNIYQLLTGLPILFLTKYLIIDIYLFFGFLAMAIYDEKSETIIAEKPENLEATLTELSRLNNGNPDDYSEELLQVRTSLVGMTTVLKTDPNFKKWKNAMIDAAGIISEKHFPETRHPLYEARLGPLMIRSRSWFTTFGRSEEYPVAGHLLKLRLETIFTAKSITDTVLPSPVRKIMGKTQKAYGWLKWPLNVYLWTSKGAFVKIAIDAGWFAGRKAILAVIFGKTFDKACKELEVVYRLSAKK